MSNNSDIDINHPFTRETMPKYYDVLEPHLPSIWPGRDLVANPLKLIDFVKDYVVPATEQWKFSIDAAAANQDVTDDYIVQLIAEYVPNALYFDGKFIFKDEEDMTHAKMKHF